MPEGPSIVILKEEVLSFAGQKIISVEGNTKIDQTRLLNQKIISFQSWGKHFLICFEGFTLRVHFLLFGSYSINQKKPRAVRLGLGFKKGEINFYTCSLRYLEGPLESHYDFSRDVMNDDWDPKKAKKELKSYPDKLICDGLLEQDIFAGVGNIIKNEILYRVKIHPESKVKALPEARLKRLVDETRIYSFQFLEWKKKYELKKHWLAHNKKMCLRCNLPFVRQHTGVKHRRSFFCLRCQKLYV